MFPGQACVTALPYSAARKRMMFVCIIAISWHGLADSSKLARISMGHNILGHRQPRQLHAHTRSIFRLPQPEYFWRTHRSASRIMIPSARHSSKRPCVPQPRSDCLPYPQTWLDHDCCMAWEDGSQLNEFR